MQKCLDDNAAAEFVGGTLAPHAFSAVESHLATCRECRSLVATLAVGANANDSEAVTSRRGGPPRMVRAPSEPGREYAVGDRIGRYLVLHRIGAGGMGVVFSAYDPQLDRKVALKLVRTGTAIGADEARARMVREAKAIAQLSNPHVVAVYDVGTASRGAVYIAMEFVEGDTLTQWLSKWQRSWRDVLEVLLQAGRGLAAAHSAGLLHRDFKPDNVLVGADQRVRVGDFGLARSQAGPDETGVSPTHVAALHTTLTATGAVLGTPRYMAPETLRGHATDARSDQYAFCLTAYEALYGRHPIPGESAIAIVDKGQSVTPPPTDCPVPAAIGRAILRGLEEQPGKRHPSMQALLAELAPPQVTRRRRPAMLAAGGLLIVAAATAGGTALWMGSGRADQFRAENMQLRRELDVLVKQRAELLDRVKNAETIQQTILDAIAKKDEEIQILIQRLAETGPPEIDMSPTFIRRPKPPLPIEQRVRRAFASADGILDGCINEWRDRVGRRNTDLLIDITVGVDGKATAQAGTGVNASFKTCVGDALARLPHPATGVSLELEVAVTIVDGSARIAPRILRVDSER